MSFASRLGNGSDFLGVRGLSPRVASTLLALLVLVWIIPHRKGDELPEGNRQEMAARPHAVGAPAAARPPSYSDRLTSLTMPKIPGWMPYKQPSSPRDDLLIIYAYFETDAAFENAKYFIQAGLHDSADFIFMLNGETPRLEEILPKVSNLEVFRRDNTCFDMGGYGDLIRQKNLLNSHYKKFILVNASVRGPFLPTWSTDCWSTAWLRKISETMKLQGMSTNCARQFHVQSMVIGTDRVGLESMVNDGTFDCPSDMWAAQTQEVGMASKIMRHGWEINAWMTALHGDPAYDDRENCGQHGIGDHLFKGSYFGFDISPYETMFTKGNRDLEPMVGKLTEWHTRMNYTSYDYC